MTKHSICTVISFWPACCALLGVLTGAPRRAAAEASAADSAAAQALFEEAQRLMKTGKPADLALACPKLVESQRLDPGVGTLLNLGLCYQMIGKTASSYGAFGDAAVMARKAGDKARQTEAERQTKAMEARLSKLLITVTPMGRAPGLTVRRDGREIAEALWGSAIPVDPGEHALEATAPGKKRWTATVRVPATPGEVTAEVPALADAPPEMKAGEGAERAGWWNAQRATGFAVGGIGVAGIVIGSIFGAKTLGKTSEANGHCSTGDPAQCDPVGLRLEGEAKTTGTVSTVAFIVGGAAIVGGVVLVVTAHTGGNEKGSKVARLRLGPAVGVGTLGLSMQGAW